MGTGRPGGVETFVRTLIDNLDHSRYYSSVCILGDEGPVSEHLRNRGIEVNAVGAGRGSSRLTADIFGLVRRVKPDILHSNVGSLAVRIGARTAGCGHIITHIHGPPDSWVLGLRAASPDLRRKLRRLAAASDNILVCSRTLESQFSAILPQIAATTRVIHYGVELEQLNMVATQRLKLRREFGIPPDRFVVGFIGRLVPQKGIPALVETIKMLRDLRPQISLLIVGDGTLRPLVANALTPATDRWIGEHGRAAETIPAMDLLLGCSEWEGFPLVNLEAMAVARAVVCFGVDGISEAVVDRGTGILVTPGDSAGLAEAVRYLASNPDWCRTLGLNGLRRVTENFTARGMAEQVAAVYSGERLSRG